MVNRTVVVTGMAWSTALGDELDAVWRRLLAGDSGLRPVPSPYPLRNLRAAALPGPPDGALPDRRQVRLAVRTVTRALADARLDAGEQLLVAGTSYGAHLDDDGVPGLHQWAAETAAQAGLRRSPVSLSTACSSGADVIAAGAVLIQAGEADTCVCAGVDILTEAKRLGHSALGTMSPGTLRSFDPSCDGTLLGEGAAVVVLETAAAARRRGAEVHATFRGAGAANDAAGLTAPDVSGDGVVLALSRSLAAAGADPDDVSVINAHGSGTPVNDTVEAASLDRVFATGDRRPVVFATKGAFGHTLGATGAIEAVALIKALQSGQVPPVVGLGQGVPPLSVLPVPAGVPRGIASGLGVSLTLGFGGFNTSLVFEGTTGAAH